MYAHRTISWVAHALIEAMLVWPVAAQNATPAAQAVDKSHLSSQNAARKSLTFDEFVDSTILQERRLTNLMRYFKPVVETYVQEEKHDSDVQTSPKDDDYFLSRLDLTGNAPATREFEDPKHSKLDEGKKSPKNAAAFAAGGFAQTVFPDQDHFDRQNYAFNFARREILGEVRCVVINVTPRENSTNRDFVGRIWVEDQDFHIVRFNGAYGGSSLISNYFNFDSWRTNAGKNQWLPAFIFSQEGDVHDEQTKRLAFKPFRAQTRLWGYDLGHVWAEQELNKILVEAATPVKDESEAANDYSPLQAERSWGHQAEDNITDKMERLGLLAPRGDVDKVLETVVNNLEVTNDLDIQPEVRCRVLMISTLESFTIDHTIVLSRGLVDVLPDEGSLAAILAHELGHVVLGHRVDSQFAFLNRVRFDEKETFRHFGFARTPEEEQSANQKGIELLRKSPYKDHSGTTRLFLQALKDRSKEIPNLISPHLGDRVPARWTILSAVFSAQPPDEKPVADVSGANATAATVPAANVIVALPLGGRIKIEPWNDQLHLLKSKPVGMVAESEKMPFEVTPFAFYLTRQGEHSSAQTATAVAVKADPELKPETKP